MMQLQKMMYVAELLLNNKKMTPQPFLQSLFFDHENYVSTSLKSLEKRFSIHSFQLFKDTFINTIQLKK
jgi:hypothetical protein